MPNSHCQNSALLLQCLPSARNMEQVRGPIPSMPEGISTCGSTIRLGNPACSTLPAHCAHIRVSHLSPAIDSTECKNVAATFRHITVTTKRCSGSLQMNLFARTFCLALKSLTASASAWHPVAACRTNGSTSTSWPWGSRAGGASSSSLNSQHAGPDGQAGNKTTSSFGKGEGVAPEIRCSQRAPARLNRLWTFASKQYSAWLSNELHHLCRGIGGIQAGYKSHATRFGQRATSAFRTQGTTH